MPAISIRPLALIDLAEIWAYIAEGSPRQADRFADRLNIRFQDLGRYPATGRRRPELMSNLRSSAIGRYVIFYMPRAEGIEIVRVLHGSRDIDKVLDEEG